MVVDTACPPRNIVILFGLIRRRIKIAMIPNVDPLVAPLLIVPPLPLLIVSVVTPPIPPPIPLPLSLPNHLIGTGGGGLNRPGVGGFN